MKRDTADKGFLSSVFEQGYGVGFDNPVRLVFAVATAGLSEGRIIAPFHGASIQLFNSPAARISKLVTGR